MKKKIHDQKPSGKDILRGFISPQLEASLSESTLRNLSSPTLFSSERQKIMLAYFNMFQISGSTDAPAHWKKEYFSDWTKKERDSPCSV